MWYLLHTPVVSGFSAIVKLSQKEFQKVKCFFASEEMFIESYGNVSFTQISELVWCKNYCNYKKCFSSNFTFLERNIYEGMFSLFFYYFVEIFCVGFAPDDKLSKQSEKPKFVLQIFCIYNYQSNFVLKIDEKYLNQRFLNFSVARTTYNILVPFQSSAKHKMQMFIEIRGPLG